MLKTASQVVGLDRNEPLVEQLQAAGYDFRIVDATSEHDLGTRFDFVFAGDVMEHVDNPVALVRFALRHLAPSGRALFTTPNPWTSADPIQSILRRGTSRHRIRHVNLEHTCWITPTNFYEILIRSGVEVSWRRYGFPKEPARRVHASGLIGSCEATRGSSESRRIVSRSSPMKSPDQAPC